MRSGEIQGCAVLKAEEQIVRVFVLGLRVADRVFMALSSHDAICGTMTKMLH